MSLTVLCLISSSGFRALLSSSVPAATVENEGGTEATGGWAGEELRRQTAAEKPSPDLEGGTPEPEKHPPPAG